MIDKTPKPKTCMDSEYDPSILKLEEALTRITETIQPMDSVEQIAIHRSLNRVLAQDIKSPINVPPYDNSAMDGYAVIGRDIPKSGSIELRNTATVMAGKPYSGDITAGTCARIMTGAKMPKGADTVIMQEQVEINGDMVTIQAGHKPGENLRCAGEDISQGDIVLHKGRRITPADMGMLASLGIPEIKVFRKIRVAFFSTGDELQPLGSVLQEGQIYDSNRYSLFGILSHINADVLDMGTIPDNRKATEEAFRSAAANADVLITTGGVSVGEADFVKETLEKQGEVDFWKLAMKPGKPLAFGHLGNCWFFGLPGNPVSALVTFYQLVLPGLRKLAGQQQISNPTLRLPCHSKLKKRSGRVEFQRGIIEQDDQGRHVVTSTGNQGSHVLSSMSKANCFIILDLNCGNVEAGTEVEVQPFYGLL